MSFQAGFLNIGGLLACHRFISHVTGTWTVVGFELNSPDSGLLFSVLGIGLCFFLGNVLSGQLVDVRLKMHQQPRYYEVYGLMLLLMAAVWLFGVSGKFGEFGEPMALTRDYVLAYALSLVCGLQNGTITSAASVVVRTTHMTGVTTDLGLGVARLLNWKRINGDTKSEIRANLMRFGLIVYFIGGASVGTWVFHRFQFAGFAVPVAITGFLFSLMIYFQVIRR